MLNKIHIAGKEVAPSKVICVGQNYIEHIYELGGEIPENMVLFAKPNSAITSQVKLTGDEPIHYESEICFIYEDGEFTAVGLGLDLTKRALQFKLKDKGLPWERAKAFDGAAVFSEFVAFEGSTANLNFTMTINGEVRQEGKVSLMIYKPNHVLKEILSFISLVDGDVVMTGTPKGVGPLVAGDEIEAVLRDGDKVLQEIAWKVQA